MQNAISDSGGRIRIAKITLILIPLAVAAFVFSQYRGDDTVSYPPGSLEPGQTSMTSPNPATAVLLPDNAIAPEMRKIPDTDRSTAADPDIPQIDVMATMSLLEEIKRDDSGKLVVDTDSLRLLDKAVRALNGSPDDSSMALLGEFIEAELPGVEGEKARQIFSTYVEYKSAEDEVVSRATDAEISTAAETLEQLSELRRSYFGDDIAAQLFQEEEQFLRKTIAAMAEAEKEGEAR